MEEKITILEGVLHNLIEALTDKEENVRNTIETSLVKIIEKNSDESLKCLTEFKTKHPKINEQSTAALLRSINKSVALKNFSIKNETIQKVITMSINEMTKSIDCVPAIQEPTLEILVAIGRKNCSMVMEALIDYTKNGVVPHFMILHCMGTLATANVDGATPFIKQILSGILPNLGSIKLDHVKQAHALVFDRLSEAILENSSNTSKNNVDLNESEENHNIIPNYDTEISVAYDVFLNHWLQCREPKVCNDILHALTNMYPLLPIEKINDQSARLIPNILHLYRRSIDRNSITLFLAAVLKTNLTIDSTTLDPIIDQIITNLFDLVCVHPDYDKPQTVKGHYEVLRCFHLLSPIYSTKIMDMLLIHVHNTERERFKSLLVLTHLTNTSSEFIETKLPAFMENLKQMIITEKSIKMRKTLLKTIIALAQKSLIKEKEFVWFIVRFSCKYTKINTEYGTIDEHVEFVQLCQNSLYMLSSTIGTMDEILKLEILNYFCAIDYTDITTILMSCLSNLFARNNSIEYDVNPLTPTNGNSSSGITSAESNGNLTKTKVPSAEAVFARCITLMGNYREAKRISNILLFLKSYYIHITPDLKELWDHEIPELELSIGRGEIFLNNLNEFIMKTIEFINNQNNNENFSERLVNKLAEQLILYPVTITQLEFFIPILNIERGMLLKSIGLCLCFISDKQTVDSKIDLIVMAAKHEKLDKHTNNSEYEHKLVDAAKAFGYISKKHLEVCLKKLSELAHIGSGKKQTGGFFSHLHFMKDTNKDIEHYKINLLVFEAYGHIIENSNPINSLKNVDETMIGFLINQLKETKDQTMKKCILTTLLNICNQFLKNIELGYEMKLRDEIAQTILNISFDGQYENLPLFPIILKVGTNLVRIENDTPYDGGVLFEIACKNFFTCAQNLKTKFDSQEDDEYNSYLAQYLNSSLPEMNTLVKIIIETDPSPACLDLVISILEVWIRDSNSEVRICAGHVMNSCLDVYIKSMKIGCEAPSKFNQSGQMLGKIIPRCIDSNATVRQTSVDILQKTLEISCIYETLTIADSNDLWIRDIDKIREEIITDDSKEIYKLAGNIANVVALRMSNFQYLQFCKTLLSFLNDSEQSSAIGASVVLKFFIQLKGAELFHAIPDFVKESLDAIKSCEISRAKSGVQKALVALTKHHPKLVCNEMLCQQLPFDDCVIEFWNTICIDKELTETIIENFLQILSTSCLYEPNDSNRDDHRDERQKIATVHPFAIFCSLKEILPSKEIKNELRKKFPELFAMLLTSLSTYTNLAPPMLTPTKTLNSKTQATLSAKSKYGFIPNKELIKMNPCSVVLEAFQAFLTNLEMEQIAMVLSVCPHLSTSSDLCNFIELLTPMAVGIVNQFSINSSMMKLIVTTLSKYVSSPYNGQRIAAIGLYSQIVPLKPCGEISSVIMLHLCSALSDPNPIVRGLCIRGLAFVGNLSEHDIDKYTDTAITALLKGIDDYNNDCLINIPLESKRGLSRIFQTLPSSRIESFHVSLAIRIRPFFENSSNEIREAAILLFGDLCESKMLTNSDGSLSPSNSSEALIEQLFSNLFSLLLHLCETDPTIIRACKVTLRKVCVLIVAAPKVNEMAQKHLIDHGQLNYNNFIIDFVKLIGIELKDHIQDFIESCTPLLKSHWAEIRGNAAIIIGILNNYLDSHNQHNEIVGHKLAILLKDDIPSVRLKASAALGYFFGDLSKENS